MSQHAVDAQSTQKRTGHSQMDFLRERFWERPLWQNVRAYLVGATQGRCIDRNERRRKAHDFDKDSRCIFCDYLQPAVRGQRAEGGGE